MNIAIFCTSILAAGVASVTGFGVGSIITPVLSLYLPTKLAIAATSIPHLVATALRFWMLRSHVDRKVLIGFGLTSAIGGLIGALLHAQFETPSIALIFGVILIFSGFMGASGFSERLRFNGIGAWIGGAVSGILGGLVGNQGGIRSAALLSFNIPKSAFVATATAIALIVDGARMPIYMATQSSEILARLDLISIATAGVIIGTIAGARVLRGINEVTFRRIVSSLIFLLGTFMLYKGIRQQ